MITRFSKTHAAWNEVESGYTERQLKGTTNLSEPQGNSSQQRGKWYMITRFSKTHAAWNEVESGYTERQLKGTTNLNEPQGKFKICNLHMG